MIVPDLLIDPNIKYWVLLPISFVMVAVGILRQYIMVLLSPAVKAQPLNKIREAEYIKKSQLLKQNYENISKEGFQAKVSYLIENLSSGKFLAEEEDKDGAKKGDEVENPLEGASGEALMGMMKNQFGGFIIQSAIMGWVNFFFAGFVVMKLPFPLTLKFKQMLQSGVMTSDLDVRWVSSVSWYFIATLGLNSVYNILINNATLGSQLMQQQQQMVPQQLPGGPKMDKMMEAEANDLKILQFSNSVLDDVELRVLQLYKQ